MVGAGGIGCELLKNLMLSGFGVDGQIDIVDLDTIDLSNLNRQFLFRHEHIKKSKALVAKEVAQKFNPNVKLEAHHANIKDAQFNVEWFRQFTIVFNALDNLEARRHVNKMCLAANIPLIESGTTGFNGQVQVIKKGLTACYDCTPKVTPKSFAVCTIRSTPSQPIHCIVWGKSYLLSEVFGASEVEAKELDHTEDSENAQEIEKLRQEAEALKRIRDSMGTEVFPQLLFNKVYKEDINRLRSMKEMWTSRRAPDPLDYAELSANAESREASKDKIMKNDQRQWTLEENLIVFRDSLQRLSARMLKAVANKSEGDAEPSIEFDKDDEDTLDFVAASANIRAIIFGIETKPRFEIKQMAGNIIPAIATTNAIVAGLCVLQSFKVLQNDYDSTRFVFLSPFGNERLMSNDRNAAPNPECPVCNPAQIRLLVDFSRATLNDLVEDLLRMKLGYGEEFVVSNEVGILYDIDETENLEKKLSELGISGESFITVTDEDEDPRVNLVISMQESKDEAEVKSIRLMAGDEEPFEIPRRSKSASVQPTGDPASLEEQKKDAKGNGLVGSDALKPKPKSPRKRLASEMDVDEGHDGKRKKVVHVTEGTEDDVIVLDTTDDGAIVIKDD